MIKKQVPPPTSYTGYRIGAKVNDKLFLDLMALRRILMQDGTFTKEYSVGEPSNNTFTVSKWYSINLSTGEKVIITSDDGDLPENLRQIQFIMR